MNFEDIHKVYFVGIGGIGMSALARYFKSQGKEVEGYDKTETELTKQLVAENIAVHYSDLGDEVLKNNPITSTLIIYTPAIPKEHGELNAFLNNGYEVIKRAKALGIISSAFETFAVAGTHGKTTTSTLLAHVLNTTSEKCTAFVGGISSNFGSNTLINVHSKNVVVEADEYDRSFLQLSPKYAIVTSMDADHLDIYGNDDHFAVSFNDFMNKVSDQGVLVLNTSLEFDKLKFTTRAKKITYGVESSTDWSAENLHYKNQRFYFDIHFKDKVFQDVEFGVPGKHNCENATAVFALCIELGFDEINLREAFKTFKGVQRRFDFQIRREDISIIDDYAHHPTELTAFISSVKQLYPNKKITGVFQPHLFSRTRDFMDGFSRALSLCDEIILLDIYPARELPIEGITSQVLLEKISIEKKSMSAKTTLVYDLKKGHHEVILIMGAGDIDTCVKPVKEAYS